MRNLRLNWILILWETALAGVSKDELIERVAHPSRRRLRRLLRDEGGGVGLSRLLLGSGNVGDDAHDVAFLHDQQLLAVDLDFGARPLAEQHAVTDLEIDRDQLAGLFAATRADGGDVALRGLFLGTIRNDDAASCLLFGVDTLDHNAVVKRTEFHGILLGFCMGFLDWQSQAASASPSSHISLRPWCARAPPSNSVKFRCLLNFGEG